MDYLIDFVIDKDATAPIKSGAMAGGERAASHFGAIAPGTAAHALQAADPRWNDPHRTVTHERSRAPLLTRTPYATRDLYPQAADPRWNDPAFWSQLKRGDAGGAPPGAPTPFECYQFAWDRMRAIRKDFTLQVGVGGSRRVLFWFPHACQVGGGRNRGPGGPPA